MNLEKLYQLRRQAVDKKSGANSIDLLTQTHWFTSKANFDPKTGEALPQVLSKFLAKITKTATDGKCHDRLWRITEHARQSVERLLRALNESPRREQALLPIHAVRELDANSFIKLSNRPGRNIREKLAGKPYLQAVRRFQSVNLPENRLLKAFVTRLAELLELRRDCLGEEEDELLPKIQLWIRSEEAQAIARWDNLPPNNTLLSHRDYRRVWDAWRWLQTLDDDIARDFSQLESREETMQKWNEYGQIYINGTHRFAEMPVVFNYEMFEISPWVSQLALRKATHKIARSIGNSEFSEPACVDFSALRPRYATTRASSTSLHESYLWQQWKNTDESVEIELFNSDAAYLHLDTTSISSTDLFFSKDNTHEHLDRAARAFASRLRDIFKNDTLIWLVPDFLNDFEVEITRRNINARFPDAEPLPRSVAAVFEQVDYSKINRNGFSVVVVDHIEGKTCATKLIAQFDADLKQRLPNTGGFYWERCPPVIVSERHARKDCFYDMVTVDGNGKWHNSAAPERPQFMDASHLKADPRIGNFAFYITLSHSPVAGGMRLHALQSQAGDIPLWRDRLPELSIEVRSGGAVIELYLVSRESRLAVIPQRGAKTPIPLSQNVTLRAGKHEYRFPLVQDKGKFRLEYDAFLRSPVFPLTEETEWRLELTYKYGEDNPYELRFISPKNRFPPILTAWRPISERPPLDLNTLPIPSFPAPKAWEEFRNFPTLKGNTVDIVQSIAGFEGYLRNIHAYLSYTAGEASINNSTRLCGTITRVEEQVADGKRSINGTVSDGMGGCYSFRWGPPWVQEGAKVSFEVKQKGRYRIAEKLARGHDLPENYANRIESELGLHLRRLTTGHSFTDSDCPAQIRNATMVIGDMLTRILNLSTTTKKLQSSVLLALACLGDCCPDDIGAMLVEGVKQKPIEFSRYLSYAIGSGTKNWQRELLDMTICNLRGNQCKEFLSSLSVAAWRVDFVALLSYSQVSTIIEAEEPSIQSAFERMKTSHDEQARVAAKRLLSQLCELVLAMLRTRESPDLEMKKLLSPDSKCGKRLVTLVDNITKFFIDQCEELRSRIALQLNKPQDSAAVPDLLYALRLYLTGDDGANAIHITGISDTDDD